MKSKGFLELREVVNTGDSTLGEESFKDVVMVEDLDMDMKPLPDADDIEPMGQKVLANDKVQNVIDDIPTANSAEAVEMRLDATIFRLGDRETVLAGDNLASSLLALDLVDVRESVAVLAVGDVIPKGRSNSATAT